MIQLLLMLVFCSLWFDQQNILTEIAIFIFINVLFKSKCNSLCFSADLHCKQIHDMRLLYLLSVCSVSRILKLNAFMQNYGQQTFSSFLNICIQYF